MHVHSVFLRSVLYASLAICFLLSSCSKTKRLHGEWAVHDIRHNTEERDSALLADCQTMVVAFTFLEDGQGQLTNNRGRLFDMIWSYSNDELTIASEDLGRDQTLAITWEDKNTFFIDNCLCTYEFHRK